MDKLQGKALELKNQYQREWAKKHKDQVRTYTIKHWEKKAAELKAEREQQDKTSTNK